jgi:hypothetical protein
MKIKSKNILNNQNTNDVRIKSSASSKKITEVLKAFNLFKEFKTAKLTNSLLNKKRQLSRKKKLIFIKRTQKSNLLRKGKFLNTKNYTILIKLRNKIFKFKRNKILFKGKTQNKNLKFKTSPASLVSNSNGLLLSLPILSKSEAQDRNSNLRTNSSNMDLNMKALSWKFKILNKRHYKILSRLQKVNFKLIKNFNFPVDAAKVKTQATKGNKFLAFSGIASQNLVNNINFLEGIRYINSLSLMISLISNSKMNQGQPAYKFDTNNNPNFALGFPKDQNRKPLEVLNQKELFVGSRLISLMKAEPVCKAHTLSIWAKFHKQPKKNILNSTEEGFVSLAYDNPALAPTQKDKSNQSGTQLNSLLIENNLFLKAPETTSTHSSNILNPMLRVSTTGSGWVSQADKQSKDASHPKDQISKRPKASNVTNLHQAGLGFTSFSKDQGYCVVPKNSVSSSKYNLNSLKNIKSKVALNSLDFSTESLSLIKKLDLAFSTSQSKSMQENLLHKINLGGADNPISKFSGLTSEEVDKSAKTISFLNLWSSLSFNRKAYIDASNLITEASINSEKEISNKPNLSENTISKVTKDLPPQPKIRMADQNYITYPYKKRVKSPSFISTYFTWKSGNSVYAILKYSFERMSCLISKPFFYETPHKMIIQIFYYSIIWDGFRYRQRPFKNYLLQNGSPDSSLNDGIQTHSDAGGPVAKVKTQAHKQENKNSYWVSLPVAKVGFATQAKKDSKGSSFSASFPSNAMLRQSNHTLQNETDILAKIQSFKKIRVIQKKAENLSKSLIEKRKRQIITNFLIKNKTKFDKLCLILSKLLNKKVVLDLNRLKRPYLDVTILAQLFHKNTQEKKSKIIRLISSLFYTLSKKYDWASDSSRTMSDKKMKLHQTNGSLKGFFIKVGGRLLSQKIIPRISSKTYNRGKLARGKVHFVNTSRINNKHKRGAYSITITTSSIAL